MDKEKVEKTILNVLEKYLEFVEYDFLEIYCIKKEELPSVAKDLAEKIVIDWEDIEKIISPIALSAGFNESWICSTMVEEITEACPIKIKEKEADDET